MTSLIYYSFALFAFALTRESLALEFSSGVAPVNVLELYTSEGCSSCPPAEAWLGPFRDDPRLWREVIPIVFHVDYWDKLGWPDAFATAAHTARQRQYAAGWRSGSIYTPGFVLNGQEWRGWFKQEKLAWPTGDRVGNLTIVIDNHHIDVRFEPIQSWADELEINLAVLGFGRMMAVTAGENRQRTLRHDFTALAWERHVLKRHGEGIYLQRVAFPSVSPAMAVAGVNAVAAEQAGESARDRHLALAAWVSTTTHPQPLQATGGWLEKLPLN